MDLTASVNSVTPAEQRLLDTLIEPMMRQEIASRLGVTRQRVSQLEARLLEKDLIRVSDNGRYRHFIVKVNDETILISSLQARILSAMRVYEKALTSSIAAALSVKDEKLQVPLSELENIGLVSKVDHFSGRITWTLTDQGRRHRQRRENAQKATLAPSGVRSARSINVLSLLANEGPTRGRDISERLGLNKVSINAFMQYLKGKGWIRKAGGHQEDPYELTATGLQLLDGLSSQTREA